MSYFVSYEFFEVQIHGVCNRLLLLIYCVLINIFEHVCGCMSHTLHRIFIRDTEGQHNGCVIMSKVVEAAVDTQLFADMEEAHGDGGRSKIEY